MVEHSSGFQLEENDKILYEGKMTWIANWWLIPFAIVFILAGNMWTVAVGIAFIAWIFIDAYSSHYIITHNKIYLLNNIILKKRSIIDKNEISSIKIEKGLWHFIIKYGTITIYQGKKKNSLSGIVNPESIVSLINQK